MHRYQKRILKELTFKPKQRFSTLSGKISDISSEHFNYHLGELVRLGYVSKSDRVYKLTTEGKKYVDYLDFQDRRLSVERLPKVSVLIYLQRINEDGVPEYLMSKRLKEPYYGRVGNMTGKVKFGESFFEAAERELLEETGLKADLVIRQIYHKVRKEKEGGAPIQDVVFIMFMGKNPKGKLRQPKDGEAEFFWTTLDDLSNRDDLFKDVNLSDPDERLGDELRVVESIAIEEGF
ncbi:NUDIX domain-containing protein [Candidatus Dojkabacteria bacterium]|nr:NUDIX domain-containing protein [Candidatus Dojkabacteria bacterium]